MSSTAPRLGTPPIVEAVIDIDCEYEIGNTLESHAENLKQAFNTGYPIFNALHLQEHQFEIKPGSTSRLDVRNNLSAYQFRVEDGKQLVQVRSQGYSFNRLAPYSSLDDYLPEIERTWEIFAREMQPIKVRAVRLRYINRILFPFVNGEIDLNKYLKVAPQLPRTDNLTFTGFLNQHSAIEKSTGYLIQMVTVTQNPENDRLPIIIDNMVTAENPLTGFDKIDWSELVVTIQNLRNLKNRLFNNTLTPECLNQFQ